MSDEAEIHPEETAGATAVAVGRGGEEEVAHTEIPSVLPVLPLKNTVLFPYLLSPLLVSSARSKKPTSKFGTNSSARAFE